MRKVPNLTLRREDGRVVAESVVVADSTGRRLRGLLGKKELPSGHAVLLRPAWSIHTAFMRFPIDVVFLDADQIVVKIVPNLPSFKTASCRGAREVVAVDVGYGLLGWALQTDDRVHVHDRTNVRHLTPEDIGGPVDLVVADLSFISLTLVLPALVACARPDADLLPMVKPQFEVGKDRLGSGGVVRDPALRAEAVATVVRAAGLLGWGMAGVVASPLPGPSGNVEFFVHLRRDTAVDDPFADGRCAELIAQAVGQGPA